MSKWTIDQICGKWVYADSTAERCKLAPGHVGPCRSYCNTPGAGDVGDVRRYALADRIPDEPMSKPLNPFRPYEMNPPIMSAIGAATDSRTGTIDQIARVLVATMTTRQLADVMNALVGCDVEASLTDGEVTDGDALLDALCRLSPKASHLRGSDEGTCDFGCTCPCHCG